jgi:VWFA-related protein
LTAAIDQSGSMVEAVPQLKQSVRRFLSALRPQDKVSLIFFNDNIFTPIRASVDPAVRLKAVDRLAAWGGTALYDTIVQAVDMLGQEIGRRSLVVFSDGEDTASHITLETVEKRLKMSDATVYTIAEGQAMRLEHLRGILARFARTSGGLAFATEDMERLSQAFDQILEDLSNQYLLVYQEPSPRDGAWHRIRVEVKSGNYKVRHREGYLAPAKK